MKPKTIKTNRQKSCICRKPHGNARTLEKKKKKKKKKKQSTAHGGHNLQPRKKGCDIKGKGTVGENPKTQKS